jgi:hypothetical protein
MDNTETVIDDDSNTKSDDELYFNDVEDEWDESDSGSDNDLDRDFDEVRSFSLSSERNEMMENMHENGEDADEQCDVDDEVVIDKHHAGVGRGRGKITGKTRTLSGHCVDIESSGRGWGPLVQKQLAQLLADEVAAFSERTRIRVRKKQASKRKDMVLKANPARWLDLNRYHGDWTGFTTCPHKCFQKLKNEDLKDAVSLYSMRCRYHMDTNQPTKAQALLDHVRNSVVVGYEFSDTHID